MASITLSPATAAPGTQVNVVGTGFKKNANVVLSVDSGAALKTITATGKQGRFSVYVTLPTLLSSGTHAIKATVDGVLQASANFTVPGTPPPPPSATEFVLGLTTAEIAALSTTSAAYLHMKSRADAVWPAPDIMDQDNKVNVQALAAAMVYARNPTLTSYRTKARNALFAMMPGLYNVTSPGLGVTRQLTGWVLAADFLGLTGTDLSQFSDWLLDALTGTIGTHSRWNKIREIHNDANNNWGGFAGASRIAGDLYLGNQGTDLAEAVKVFKGFMGDRTQWSTFRGQGAKNGDLYAEETPWACDSSASGFIPVNGVCTKSGINVDGAIVGDVYRDDLGLTWPVGHTGISYTTETLQGLIVQAELLYQHGYTDVWTYQNNAMKRIGDLVTRNGAAGGTTWNLSSVSYHVPWLMNKRLGTTYPKVPAQSGRAFGFTDWLYG